MQEIHWVILFLVTCVLVSLIATKKGRSGMTLFACIVLAPLPLIIAVSYALGANMEAKGPAMLAVSFLCPVVGFFWAIMTPNKDEMVVLRGEYGGLRKCPFCAESVRKEAVKCKHCGSELRAVG